MVANCSAFVGAAAIWRERTGEGQDLTVDLRQAVWNTNPLIGLVHEQLQAAGLIPASDPIPALLTSWKPKVNGLMVQVNYGFTHATFKDYKDERRGIDYSGNFLPMVPRHTFAVGADYTIPNPCRHIDRFTVSANYTGTGRILWKEDNKVSQPYYGLLNAKVSATKDFITFAIWAKNMTGADYSAFYFETGGKGLAQKGRPFTIGGNIQLSF